MEIMEGHSRNEAALGKQLRDRRRGSVMVGGSGIMPPGGMVQGGIMQGMSPAGGGFGKSSLGGLGGMDSIGE